MIKHKLALSLALAALVSFTGASAADSADTWQPGIYFKMDFGGPAKRFDAHYGAQLSLTTTALDTLSGGNGLSQIKCAAKNECSNGFAGRVPAYMSVDFNPGKAFSAQWLGSSFYHYDYGTDISSAPMLNWSWTQFSQADRYAMYTTAFLLGSAGLAYGIASATGSNPTPAPGGGGG